jgi:hypothetical protein
VARLTSAPVDKIIEHALCSSERKSTSRGSMLKFADFGERRSNTGNVYPIYSVRRRLRVRLI